MESNSNLKNVALMAFVAASVMLIFTLGTHAQGNGRWSRNDDYYGRNGGYNGRQVSDRELRRAYERGMKQGEKDARRDARSGYNRNGGVTYGNRGYGTYGGNGRYNGGGYGGGQIQRAYADGYRQGYQRAYDQNVRYDRNRRYGNRNIFGFPLPY